MLDLKNELKMIEFSSSLNLNEIRMVNSPSQKYNIFHGGPNFGEGTAGNLGNMSNNRDIYCYADRRVVNFEREYQPLSLGTKIPVMPQFSDQILGKKRKKLTFQVKIRPFFLGSVPPKM